MAGIYVDNDVAVAVVTRLQARGHAATHTRALGLMAAPDGYQLLPASQSGLLLITHNRNDFELLHDSWLRWSKAWGVVAEHAGILVLPQGDAESNAERVDAFFASGAPLTNAFYEWRNGGWVAWQPRGGMIP